MSHNHIPVVFAAGRQSCHDALNILRYFAEKLDMTRGYFLSPRFPDRVARYGTLLAIIAAGGRMETLKHRIEEIEKEEIIRALKESDWIMAKAARKLGLTERMIAYKIKKYGLRIKEVRWIEKDPGHPHS